MRCEECVSAGSLTSHLPGGWRLEFLRRTLAVSNAGADAGTGGGTRAPTGDPKKPIGQDEEGNRLEAKGDMRHHLPSVSDCCRTRGAAPPAPASSLALASSFRSSRPTAAPPGKPEASHDLTIHFK